MVNYYAGSPAALPAPGKQISDYPLASGSKTTLTRIPPCRLFLVASLGAFFSASYRLSSLLSCGELDC